MIRFPTRVVRLCLVRANGGCLESPSSMHYMDIKLYGCLAVEMFSSLDIKLHIVFNKPYHHRNEFSQVS